MMEILEAYIPTDRRGALAAGRALPDHTHGAALFADISGFTPLTEALARMLGPRRGAEELSVHLNLVYEALIHEVDRFGGSVIGFAGDAITCWFDRDNGWRATVCALAMQATMAQFTQVRLPKGDPISLAVKIAIAAGPARRLLAGNPEVQVLDVLAGRTLASMGAAAHAAARGEIVLDAPVTEALGSDLEITEWREGGPTGSRFAVVGGCRGAGILSPRPAAPELPHETLRCWLLRPIYERLRSGQGEFLTELRPANALFVKFEGIDYDADPQAGDKLDTYVRWVQKVVGRYEGFVIDISVGDKGSCIYACFGAPIAHENDPWRAVAAAGELVRPPSSLAFVTASQIGLSGGTLRTGAYGSTLRRCYGVLGDEVNLAARLMEHATPGQVLVSERIRQSTGNGFRWQEMPPLKAKGKSEPVRLFALLGHTRGDQGSRLRTPHYATPMVGRGRELDIIGDRMALALGGAGQIVRIQAEAGMGKSRLVAEILRTADKQGMAVHVGECLSHGTATSYLAWQNIWHGLLEVPEGPLPDQAAALERRLRELDPSFLPRLPLLGAVLNLPLPENEVTRLLEARLRKASLEALLTAALRKIAAGRPLLLVIEDTHWIDALSRELLAEVARVVVQVPVFLVVTHRPAEAGRGQPDPLSALPHVTTIELAGLTDTDATLFASLKLSRLFGYEGPPPPILLERLLGRAAGNPFYLEELVNFLKDRHIDFQDAQAVADLELPDSLHSLVLSRVDRLSETQRTSLKIASVIGRLFPAALVSELQPWLDRGRVATDLEHLHRVDLTLVDQPEPELVYLFKHVVTQEVTYESLPHATRSRLHGEIGLLLEQLHGADLDQHLDILAFHFDRSTHPTKKCEYLLRAGEAARARYANTDAISYLERALPLLGPAERLKVFLQVGKVRELIGEWKEAGRCYQRAFEITQELGEIAGQAHCEVAMGDLMRKQSFFAEAAAWLNLARSRFEEIDDQAGVGEALHAAGTVAAMQGDYAAARTNYEESLGIRRQLGDKPQVAALLSNLGIIGRFEGNHELARQLNEQSLALRREIGDRWAVANSLNNLGVVLRDLRQLSSARTVLEESLNLNRQVGDRWAVANVLSSLAEVALDQQDWQGAGQFLEESLATNLELRDRTAVAFVLEGFATIAAAQDQPRKSLRLAGTASALRAAAGSPLSPSEQQHLDEALAPARNKLTPEEQAVLMNAGADLTLDEAVAAVKEM